VDPHRRAPRRAQVTDEPGAAAPPPRLVRVTLRKKVVHPPLPTVAPTRVPTVHSLRKKVVASSTEGRRPVPLADKGRGAALPSRGGPLGPEAGRWVLTRGRIPPPPQVPGESLLSALPRDPGLILWCDRPALWSNAARNGQTRPETVKHGQTRDARGARRAQVEAGVRGRRCDRRDGDPRARQGASGARRGPPAGLAGGEPPPPLPAPHPYLCLSLSYRGRWRRSWDAVCLVPPLCVESLFFALASSPWGDEGCRDGGCRVSLYRPVSSSPRTCTPKDRSPKLTGPSDWSVRETDLLGRFNRPV